MPSVLVDSHCHIHLCNDSNRNEIIKSILDNNIKVVNIATNKSEWNEIVHIASNNKNNIYGTIGIHPLHVSTIGDPIEFYDQIIEFYSNNKSDIIGIGEIGIDTYRSSDEDMLDKQRSIFQIQLKAAVSLGLPISLHIRGDYAYKIAIDIIERHACNSINMIFHCYYSNEIGDRFVVNNKNAFIGIGGIITFKNCSARDISFIKDIGHEKIITETDSPYLAPAPNRGRPNQPLWVKYTSERISQILSMDICEFNSAMFDNLRKIFFL